MLIWLEVIEVKERLAQYHRPIFVYAYAHLESAEKAHAIACDVLSLAEKHTLDKKNPLIQLLRLTQALIKEQEGRP